MPSINFDASQYLSEGFLLCLQNHVRIQDDFISGLHDRALIFSVDRKEVGRLADRLKEIVAAFMISVVTDRAFFIEWSMPEHLMDTISPKALRWERDLGREDGDQLLVLNLINKIKRNRELQDILAFGNIAPLTLIRTVSFTVTSWFSYDINIGVNLNSKWLDNIERDLLKCNRRVKIFSNELSAAMLFNPHYANRFGEGAIPRDNVRANLFSSFLSHLFVVPKTNALANGLRKNFAAFDARTVIGVHFRTGDESGWSAPVVNAQSNIHSIASFVINYLMVQAIKDPVVYFAPHNVKIREQVISQSLFGSIPLVFFKGKPGHIDKLRKNQNIV